MGVWTQKQVTVQTDISLGSGFANLISANLPSGSTFAIIVNDDLDTSSYINNQLVIGYYDSAHSKNNSFCRYRSGDYTQTSGASNIWSDTYALAALVGDTYTIFYQ